MFSGNSALTRFERLRRYGVAALFTAVTGSTALAQTSPYDPVEPIAPTSMAQCDILEAQWASRISALYAHYRNCSETQCPSGLSASQLLKCHKEKQFKLWSYDASCGGVSDTTSWPACVSALQTHNCAVANRRAQVDSCRAKVRAHNKQEQEESAEKKEREAEQKRAEQDRKAEQKRNEEQGRREEERKREESRRKADSRDNMAQEKAESSPSRSGDAAARDMAEKQERELREREAAAERSERRREEERQHRDHMEKWADLLDQMAALQERRSERLTREIGSHSVHLQTDVAEAAASNDAVLDRSLSFRRDDGLDSAASSSDVANQFDLESFATEERRETATTIVGWLVDATVPVASLPFSMTQEVFRADIRALDRLTAVVADFDRMDSRAVDGILRDFTHEVYSPRAFLRQVGGHVLQGAAHEYVVTPARNSVTQDLTAIRRNRPRHESSSHVHHWATRKSPTSARVDRNGRIEWEDNVIVFLPARPASEAEELSLKEMEEAFNSWWGARYVEQVYGQAFREHEKQTKSRQ